MLPNPSPAARRWKAHSQETSVGRKGKVALFRRLATGGEGGLLSENQLPIAAQGTGAFKGEFQGCIGGSRTAQSVLTVILKPVMRWSDQRHLGCFKNS